MRRSDGVVDNVTFRIISFIQVSGVSSSADARVISQVSWLGPSVCSSFLTWERGQKEVRAVVEDSKLLSVGACASPGARPCGNWVKPQEGAGCQRRQERCRAQGQQGIHEPLPLLLGMFVSAAAPGRPRPRCCRPGLGGTPGTMGCRSLRFLPGRGRKRPFSSASCARRSRGGSA